MSLTKAKEQAEVFQQVRQSAAPCSCVMLEGDIAGFLISIIQSFRTDILIWRFQYGPPDVFSGMVKQNGLVNRMGSATKSALNRDGTPVYTQVKLSLWVLKRLATFQKVKPGQKRLQNGQPRFEALVACCARLD